MNEKNLELFQQTLRASSVNCRILYQDETAFSHMDCQLRMHLYENYSYLDNFKNFTHLLKSGTMIRFLDDFEMYYFFLHIPEEYLEDYQLPYFSVGPFLESRPDDSHIQKNMFRCRIPDTLFNDVAEFYASIPVLENIAMFENFTRNLASGLFGQEYHVLYLPDTESSIYKHANMTLRLRQNPQLAMYRIEERYETERQMMSAISNGDYNRAHEYHQKFTTYYIQPRTDNLLHNFQNFQIILNTLCRKAAELGGVHPLYIDDLSTKFAIAINEARSQRELQHIAGDMIHKYCILVKNYALKGYSQAVKDVISYIDFHYAEDLGLAFFADMLNLTKNYLSSLFKKETGLTLTDYIHQVRVRQAITLINSTSLPISTIATACGYNDINYFIRIFKKIFGISPKQYQKTILHSGR